MKKGIPASKGYAVGFAFLIGSDEAAGIIEKDIAADTGIDIAKEKEKLEIAIDTSRQQLLKLMEKAEADIGEEAKDIFKSHLMFLKDPEFIGAAMAGIEANQVSAARSVNDVLDSYVELFSHIDDEYLCERVADLKDVGARLLKNLNGRPDCNFDCIPENAVIIAYNLSPSDTAQIDKGKAAAFLTDVGGCNSHSAIMARMLGIPAVVGLNDITACVKAGDRIIVDGVEGIVIINPDEEAVALYENRKKEYDLEKNSLKRLVNMETVTKSGKHIIVAGNIGSPEDVQSLIDNGAHGVGLFRTEFLYMDRDSLPTEDEQFEAYKYVAERMAGKPVIIRTLDIGGDKTLPYLPLPKEMNPFLGLRAIRLCLKKTEMFKDQLRAILRASSYGNIKIMFPMISSLDEFLEARQILKNCMIELENEGRAFNNKIETGIMVEIPSAAIIADELAKHADFFSIGTNDLVQYTLAVDRVNENVSYLYNSMHPAVLRLIKMTIEAAHKEGKWCGMCGEMAGDINATKTLLEFGLDEFSMSASSILQIKKLILDN